MSDFNSDKNRAVWFDIPVADLDRAAAFYRAVLAVNVHVEQFGETRFGVLAHSEGNGGCLVVHPQQVAADRGVLLYLNVRGRIRDAVRQVTALGGQIIEDIHSMIEVLRSLGVEPTAKRYVMLKSRIHYRAGFKPIAKAIVECDGEGVTTSDYGRFRFETLERPAYPLDA